MKFLEKDLEEIIYETHNKDNYQLWERNLYTNGKMLRQLNIGSYGIADLVTFERGYVDPMYPNEFVFNDSDFLTPETNYPTLRITVYELKKDKIGIAGFLQAVGYVKGIQRYLASRKRFKWYHVIYEIVLIGKNVDTSGNFCYITDLFPKVSFVTYKYSINGLSFTTSQGYRITDEGFKIHPSKRINNENLVKNVY